MLFRIKSLLLSNSVNQSNSFTTCLMLVRKKKVQFHDAQSPFHYILHFKYPNIFIMGHIWKFLNTCLIGCCQESFLVFSYSLIPHKIQFIANLKSSIHSHSLFRYWHSVLVYNEKDTSKHANTKSRGMLTFTNILDNCSGNGLGRFNAAVHVGVSESISSDD